MNRSRFSPARFTTALISVLALTTPVVVQNLGSAIAILHDGIRVPSRSIEALPQILAAGKQKGLQFRADRNAHNGGRVKADARPGIVPIRSKIG